MNFDVVGRTAHDFVRNNFFFGLHLVVPATHKTLDGVDRIRRVGNGLSLGGFTDKGLPLLSERDDAGRDSVALLIGDHLRLAPFYDGNHGVGGAQIDSDHFFSLHRHDESPVGFVVGFRPPRQRLRSNECCKCE